MMIPRFPVALALLTTVLALAWMPVRAQAQFSFTLDPATQSALPGANAVTFSGKLTNGGTTNLTSDPNPTFNLLSGPDGADLSSNLIYLDSIFAPDSLAPGDTVSRIFSVNIDPAALLGQYTGNFTLGYGGQLAGKDMTINVVSATVPEVSTLLPLLLGCALLGILCRPRRQSCIQI